MAKITARSARSKLVNCLQALGYVLERLEPIDIYFRRDNRLAAAQVSTHLGITRLCLTFGLDHALTKALIVGVGPYFRIWNVGSPIYSAPGECVWGLPFFQCPIVEPFTIDEFEGEVPIGGVDKFYYEGLGAPQVVGPTSTNSTMILPSDRGVAYGKIEAAVGFEEIVFSKILPKIDGMLPCLEPAWFLWNTTPAGKAIVMLARAIELGLGRRQFEFFQEYMMLRHGLLGEGPASAGWRNALPAIEHIIHEWEASNIPTAERFGHPKGLRARHG